MDKFSMAMGITLLKKQMELLGPVDLIILGWEC
jgi:hypothetical protein